MLFQVLPILKHYYYIAYIVTIEYLEIVNTTKYLINLHYLFCPLLKYSSLAAIWASRLYFEGEVNEIKYCVFLFSKPIFHKVAEVEYLNNHIIENNI